jgi:hypothetical protein
MWIIVDLPDLLRSAVLQSPRGQRDITKRPSYHNPSSMIGSTMVKHDLRHRSAVVAERLLRHLSRPLPQF